MGQQKEAAIPDLTTVYGSIWQSPDLDRDLQAVCDCGGRFAGSESELHARTWARERLAEAAGKPAQSHIFPFRGWTRGACVVNLLQKDRQPVSLEATSLVLSPATPPSGLTMEVIDLGRGTEADFAACRPRLRGRAVLVRHEFPFTTAHVHRRRKYQWAVEAGAAAFLIANAEPLGGVVTGSTGRGDAADIPAVGLSTAAGDRLAHALARAENGARVALSIESTRADWLPENLYVEIPGQTDEWVVLCAHLDGHHLAESALDNGSGVAAVLEVTRRLAPLVPSWRRGLRSMLFTVEEWGVWGSGVYVSGLSEVERRKIALAINLDTVTGHPRLCALTNGAEDVEQLLLDAADHFGGAPLRPIRPVLGNSDHINFFLGGIPSLRLIAGYDDPTALSRVLLTPADTRDKVDPTQLRTAAMTAAGLVAEACTSTAPPVHRPPPPEVPLTPGFAAGPT